MNNAEYLPDNVRIGSKVYKVVAQDSKWYTDTESHGLMDLDNHIINVVTEDRQLGDILDTLLHETLHAVWAEWNLPQRPKEERAVTALGTGLAAVFAQNIEYARAVELMAEEIGHG